MANSRHASHGQATSVISHGEVKDFPITNICNSFRCKKSGEISENPTVNVLEVNVSKEGFRECHGISKG